MAILKNALMCIYKVKLINRDCLLILMLLYTMLAFAMSAALSIAVYLHAFCFHACLGLLTQFVYFKYDFASRTVLLFRWFFLGYVHTVFSSL